MTGEAGAGVMPFSGKAVVVTGAGLGVSAATAGHLARDNAFVVLCDCGKEQLDQISASYS